MKVFTLKKRKDFVKAAKGFKAVVNGLVLQAAFALPKKPVDACFVGYTATKKLGKAHVRNFTKRRLREAARIVMPKNALSGVNYVIIGRHNTTSLNFSYLTKKLTEAVSSVNEQILQQGKHNDKKSNDCTD